jgi:hypothetical protein
MKSLTTDKFWATYARLPKDVRQAARKQYRVGQKDPYYHSVQFKRIGELWSARVTKDYRALAILESDTYYWFWIGTHADYDRMIRSR